MTLDRSELFASPLHGWAWCEEHTRLIDKWLAALFEAASHFARGTALVAIGGYGRGEMCPASDIDVMLVHDKKLDVKELADRLWYPIWDEGLKLGHSVSTVRQALALAGDEIDTATALLQVRHIAGDVSLTDELAERAQAQWRGASRRSLSALEARVDERHAKAGEVAFLLEPDLKEGRGGMRDVHALHWAEAAHSVFFANDEDTLASAYEVLLAARVELQRRSGRASNILTRQEQAGVAAALGDPSADALLHRVADAARAIAWTSDDSWRRVRSTLRGPRGRGAGEQRPIVDGVIERDAEIALAATNGTDPGTLTLRVAAASATHDLPISRDTLVALGGRDPSALVWNAATRDLFHSLLLAGRPAIGVIEALDHHGLWTRVLPEWSQVRALPQHNPYHRFTVDRHLLETVANAAARASRVDRPDLLVVGALLHDLGKGSPGDHTAAGVRLAETVATRMAYSDGDVAVLQSLVRNHLLLPDVASRRDIDDPATVDAVVVAVGTTSLLRLLAVMTEADALATGPSAWSPWKAELVSALVDRVAARLDGTPLPVGGDHVWPREAIATLDSLGPHDRHISAAAGVVTVVTEDRPGVFSRVAGALALRGLDVYEAVAYPTDEGRAASRFRVVDRRRTDTPWDAVEADLERALDGRLAIPARLAERARAHARHGRQLEMASGRVTFDNSASADATVVDVEAPDAVGMLYRITRALTDLDLDIQSARVQTLGELVVDAFYVRDRRGGKIVEPDALAEIERAVLHAISEGVELSSVR